MPAIFLSYCSQDRDAAQRLRAALSQAGVEVWMDQGDLQGGDPWDARIRREIRECALFLPLLSANTQARREGYFRREWKLAADRTQDIADSVPFIVPVVIDATVEEGALVPESFLRVQWTRLPEGNATAAFVERIRGLLADPAAHAGELLPRAARARRRRFFWPFVLAGGLVALAAAFALHLALAPGSPTRPVQPPSAAPETPTLAVLPFVDLGEDGENRFFAEGMHEDLLTNLSQVPGLRVISRTSVLSYRGRQAPLPRIARELGATHILEGSVRRAGGKVRVSAQLIEAAKDQHLWAQTYDRDLTDVFAIQTALAEEISNALALSLSPADKARLARRPTRSAEAYDLYLKARDLIHDRTEDFARFDKAETLLRQALAIDPGFAQASAELMHCHLWRHWTEIDSTPRRLELAREALEAAERSAPGSLEARLARGYYLYRGFRDYDGALRLFEPAVREAPNNADVWMAIGAIRRRQGRMLDHFAAWERCAALDPRSTDIRYELATSCMLLRDWAGARRWLGEIAAIDPGDAKVPLVLDDCEFQERKDPAWLLSRLACTPPPADAALRQGLATKRAFLYIYLRDYEGARRCLAEAQPAAGDHPSLRLRYSITRALVHRLLGEADWLEDLAQAEKLHAELGRDAAASPSFQMAAAQFAALRGERDRALALSQEALAAMPLEKDAMVGAELAGMNGRLAILGLLGERDLFFTELERWINLPGAVDLASLQFDPLWDPLRADLRWAATLALARSPIPAR